MNKFLAFTLLALVCASASANDINDEMSQLAVATSDTEEVASVPEDLKIAFEDFCISSRDWVLNDIKQSTNSMASRVFKIFFTGVEALGDESRLATDKLSKQLANPSAPIEKSEGELNQIIAEAQAKIQNQNTPAALFTAIKTTFSIASSSVGAFVNKNLDALKQHASIDTVGKSITEVCSKVREYEEEIKSQLEQYKTAALNNEEKYAQVNLDQVKCTTARRLSQIEAGCRFASNLKPFATKMLG